MAKINNLVSRVLRNLRLRSEGETPPPAEENRDSTTPETVIEKKPIIASLYSGAGNTFIIMSQAGRDSVPSLEQVIKACANNSVDGLLVLQEVKSQNYQWHFFNKDGSQAEFCGNAARCAQAHLKMTKNLDSVEHQTLVGPVKTWTEAGKHWVQMPTPQVLADKIVITVDNQAFSGFWCDTGVPHFVTAQRNFRYDFWRQISQKIRSAPELTERGANVTWVGVATQARPLQAVTYERGVEDFTQACGTGAMAAAFFLSQKWPQEKKFDIRMPGGALVVLKKESQWIMTGPVEKTGDIEGSL